jgi:hypothetical protein
VRARIGQIITGCARSPRGNNGIIRDTGGLRLGPAAGGYAIPRVVSPSSPACTGMSLRIQTIGLQRAMFSVEPRGRQPGYILPRRKGPAKEVSVLRKPPAISHRTCVPAKGGGGRGEAAGRQPVFPVINDDAWPLISVRERETINRGSRKNTG